MDVVQRIVYGLDEIFVLLPYDRGAKQAYLVLRAASLHRVLRQHLRKPVSPDKEYTELQSPVVLGDLLNYVPLATAYYKVAPKAKQPLFAAGMDLDNLKDAGTVQWGIRKHRIMWRGPDLRFESGNTSNYVSTTHLFTANVLCESTYQLLKGAAANEATTRDRGR
jgi:hypothetical protein